MQTTIPNQNLSLEPLLASESETENIKQLDNILQKTDNEVKLVTNDGEEITLPKSVNYVLSYLVHLMASGKAVSIVPYSKELTTQEAADLLNVSRPYLIKLLEQGEIPYIMVGTHRRVPFEELMKYKEQRDAKRSEGLQKLIELTEEAGLYEDEG